MTNKFKFKIGDRVKASTSDSYRTGTVTDIGYVYANVKIDNFGMYVFDVCKLTLIEENVYDEGYFEILDALIKEHVADEVTSAMQWPKAV